MTQTSRCTRIAALAASLACAAACSTALSTGTAWAAKKSKSSAAAQKSESKEASDPKAAQAAAARQAYDAGLKSYANGKYQPAVDQFTSALGSGGLSSSEMAKALYTRGLAQKKLGKSGLAISDITSALWLKNGLSEADRKAATSARAEAYAQAGLQPPTDVQQSSGVAVADDPSQNLSAGLSDKAIAQASGAAPPAGAYAPSGVTRQAPDSPAAQDAAKARASYAPVNDGALQSLSSTTIGGASASSGSTASLASSAAPAAASTTASPMSAVTGFFSNIFGGGSSQAPAAAPAPAPVQLASNAPMAPEVSSWSQSTTVTTGGSHKSAVASGSRVAAVTPAAAPRPKGKYKIHIAALRSRAEADALAQKLVAEHGPLLASHSPTVDSAVIGSMGTFYRVRIPGYASKEEPSGICSKLRSSGLDCLVVTN